MPSQDAPVRAHGHDGAEAAGCTCDYCGAPFERVRKGQKFCCTAHRRAFEAIIYRVARQLHPAIRAGMREILAARQLNTSGG